MGTESGGRSTATPPDAASLDPYSYDGFRRAAVDSSLSVYQKIGFPDEYREGKDAAILADIRAKLTNLDRPGQRVIDIGSGCSPLTSALISHCQALGHSLTLIDSEEMLDQLSGGPLLTMQPGRFPTDHRNFVAANRSEANAILVYSVLQYVLAEASVVDFLDSAVELLAEGGQLLAGDIPNTSMRARYFSSTTGLARHREYTGDPDAPAPTAPPVEARKFDDGLLLGLLARYRAAGYHAFLVPQSPDLPIATRREDLLIVRP